MKNVLITGGSGLVGTRLTGLLKSAGYTVSHLSRSKSKTYTKDVPVYTWDIGRGDLEDEAITSSDYIIHLAGAGVADSWWTFSRKRKIWDSRVKSSQLLYEKLSALEHRVQAVISASAVGIYGDTGELSVTEESEPSNDFLGRLCRTWEGETDKISGLGIRTVAIRTGIVLSGKGGALPKMSKPVKMSLGAPLGSGKQYVPWIHIDDLCGIYKKTIEDETMRGPYNGVAPNPVTNRELTAAMAKVLDKPLLLPAIPAFLLKIIAGEMSTILLDGQRISAEKIQKTGYDFQYPVLEGALSDLL